MIIYKLRVNINRGWVCARKRARSVGACGSPWESVQVADAFREGAGLRTSTKVRWPSGLRRQLKALVRKGVGSNPTLIILFTARPIIASPHTHPATLNCPLLQIAVDKACHSPTSITNQIKSLTISKLKKWVTGFWGFGEIGRASCRERV